eukprot:TRINITY_DN2834_c0_g1_i1.p1 TRINITY_DN2834_c0_g1~~TRINITY_DN2834_c0_g1_i1.p1  ORF type:complete len:117 (+),score=16.86 TRINITY_DN2834_c0_g1_i1:44-394(+)
MVDTTIADLRKQLAEQKRQLLGLRLDKVTGSGGAKKLLKISNTRKGIAKINTSIRQIQLAELREEYKGKSLKPIIIRRKFTRAMRRQLSEKQLNAKVPRQIKREKAFPKRVYAVTA